MRDCEPGWAAFRARELTLLVQLLSVDAFTVAKSAVEGKELSAQGALTPPRQSVSAEGHRGKDKEVKKPSEEGGRMVRFVMTGTRIFGCVLMQKEKMDTQMKKTEMMATPWGRKKNKRRSG